MKGILVCLMMIGGQIIATEPIKTQVQLATATFAGGCFWCMEPPFQKLKGVSSVLAGYAGGTGKNPTYEDYATKGFVEAVEIMFDPHTISYNALLDLFWRNIDPTDAGGQFADRGPQYRSVIYYHSPEQKTDAQKSKEALQQSGIFNKPIVTEIIPFTNFYPAEQYHQNYHEKNPIRYGWYRFASGRDQFLNKIWAGRKGAMDPKYTKKSDAQLRGLLTPIQYEVTQKNGTERAFDNAYWDNHRPGIYVDIVSGEPLFSSLDKFDSKTGWPSFTKPLVPENIVEKNDRSWFAVRTEVRSKHGDSHLGHVFNDGPPPTRLRYCMNSAALRFVPVEDLEKEGYGEYIKLFDEKK